MSLASLIRILFLSHLSYSINYSPTPTRCSSSSVAPPPLPTKRQSSPPFSPPPLSTSYPPPPIQPTSHTGRRYPVRPSSAKEPVSQYSSCIYPLNILSPLSHGLRLKLFFGIVVSVLNLLLVVGSLWRLDVVRGERRVYSTT